MPNRRAGSFGSSLPGRAAEFVTLTWFRWELFLCWMGVLTVSISLPRADVWALPLALVASPALAFASWCLLKMSGWLFYFMPVIGPIWGWGRIIFLRLFSRLVAQRAPVIEIPAWSGD